MEVWGRCVAGVPPNCCGGPLVAKAQVEISGLARVSAPNDLKMKYWASLEVDFIGNWGKSHREFIYRLFFFLVVSD